MRAESRDTMGKQNGTATTNGTLATLTRQIAALGSKPVGELARMFEALAGVPTRSRNKQYLIKRVAWLMQEQASGGLSEASQIRISELGDTLPQTWRERLTTRKGASAPEPAPVEIDSRLPAIGQTLSREYKGATHTVTILSDGIEYQGKHFRSLSEVATTIAGTKWNGFRFFGVQK